MRHGPGGPAAPDRVARCPRRWSAGAATVAAAAAAIAAGCASGGGAPAPDPTQIAYAEELDVDFSRMERTPAGVWYEELTPGMGATASRGDRVWIHYAGYLPDGTVLDASVGGEPLAFDLGSREVIRGWSEGIRGMKVGGRRRLVVPPDLAYGSRGRSGVPPNSVLVFEVQLVDAS